MKHIAKRMKKQATDWEKIFAKDTSAKGLLSKIYKEFLKLTKGLPWWSLKRNQS